MTPSEQRAIMDRIIADHCEDCGESICTDECMCADCAKLSCMGCGGFGHNDGICG